MDLRWHLIMRIEWMEDYIKKHYGEVPRIRAIRFMELEWPLEWWSDIQEFNKYSWKAVINIHTRCWWDVGNEWSNYMTCWGYEREEELKKKWLFLSAHNENFDNTYRDTYVKVKKDKEYKALLAKIKELDNE